MFFVYTSREAALKEIWQYETGSLAYGCGLKSFKITKKKLVMETFGRCPKEATEYPGPGKFMVDDMTRTTFRFNGKRFTKRQTKFLSVPTRDVKNYQALVQVAEERSN